MSNSTDKELDIRKHFTEGWGRKCSEYEPNCPACRAWEWYEGAGESYLKDLVNNAVVAAVAKELSTVIKIGENTGDPSENLIVKYRRIDDYCRHRIDRLFDLTKKGHNSGKDN